MVRWGLNGRPVNEDNPPEIFIPPKPPKIKESHIKIVNKNNLINNDMEINISLRLVDENNQPIRNARIKVIDNNTHIATLSTSRKGFSIFNAGYIGLYHSFIFKFEGNKKFKPSSCSLVIA